MVNVCVMPVLSEGDRVPRQTRLIHLELKIWADAGSLRDVKCKREALCIFHFGTPQSVRLSVPIIST